MARDSRRRWPTAPVHVVDANTDSSSVVVLLHGTRHGRTCGGIRSGHSSQPATEWSHLDLVGMGMSDKPSS